MTTVQNGLVRDRLVRVVQDAVARAQQSGQLPDVPLPEVTIERPTRADQGDFATTFALKAKRAVGPRGPNPMDIASIISAALTQDPPPFLAGWESAPPGFLNFFLNDDWVRAQVDAVLTEGSAYGSVDVGAGQRAQVEFVSANPTGPLHIGHARNAALGDSLARVLAKAGWQVQREYYYNDAGAQMEHLFHSVWVRYQQALGRSVEPGPDDYPGEYVVELAQEILHEYGDRFADLPESNAEEIGSIAAKRIMEWIEAELDRARVHFDNWFSEAQVIREGDFQRVLDLLREKGLVYEREGATWLRTQDLGEERDRVLIKSIDKRPTYTATDIAYHYDKLFVRKFDRVFNVWSIDHKGQEATMQAILKALGAEPDQLEIVFYQMVNILRHGQLIRMSKRTGTIVTLSEVLDEVGVDATRWFLLSRGPDAPMEFDLDLAAKQSSENPVYYVQYAHARLSKVLADTELTDWRSGDVSLLVQPAELEVMRRMLQYPEVVDLAARTLAPHHVPFYAYELARTTQSWYDSGADNRQLRILVEGDPALQAARLKLTAAARHVLANALDLIGVVAPDSM